MSNTSLPDDPKQLCDFVADAFPEQDADTLPAETSSTAPRCRSKTASQSRSLWTRIAICSILTTVLVPFGWKFYAECGFHVALHMGAEYIIKMFEGGHGIGTRSQSDGHPWMDNRVSFQPYQTNNGGYVFNINAPNNSQSIDEPKKRQLTDVFGGRVRDLTGKPVSGVKIELADLDELDWLPMAESDANGVFRFVGLPSLESRLVKFIATKDGYRTYNNSDLLGLASVNIFLTKEEDGHGKK
jgi:hypothetical protein